MARTVNDRVVGISLRCFIINMTYNMRTKTIKQETSIVRRLGRDRMVWLTAVLAPAVLYFPIAFSDGGWRTDSAAFWWLCWTLVCTVCDNTKRIQGLCAESNHLRNLKSLLLKAGVVPSLVIMALICVVLAVFVHLPVPRRIVVMPIPIFLMVYSIYQERMLRRLKKILYND